MEWRTKQSCFSILPANWDSIFHLPSQLTTTPSCAWQVCELHLYHQLCPLSYVRKFRYRHDLLRRCPLRCEAPIDWNGLRERWRRNRKRPKHRQRLSCPLLIFPLPLPTNILYKRSAMISALRIDDKVYLRDIRCLISFIQPIQAQLEFETVGNSPEKRKACGPHVPNPSERAPSPTRPQIKQK